MSSSIKTRLCFITSTIISLSLLGTALAAVSKKFIAVTQITSHTALDAAREGVKAKVLSYAKHNNIELIWIFENAQGNIGTAAQIAQKFAGLNPDVIVAISTPSAQTAISATRNTEIPIVFCAVTDPVSAKLISQLEIPGDRVTGTYDFPPIADQLDLMLALLPHVKRIGILFNPGEVNSARQLEVFKEEADKRGLTVVEGPAVKSAEVLAATQRLLGEVDAIYIPQDNTVVSSLAGVVMLATQFEIPVIAPDPEGVKIGALATVGFSHHEEGLACGEIVVRILQGEKPGDITVSLPKKKDVYINLRIAKALGVNIPREFLKEALFYK